MIVRLLLLCCAMAGCRLADAQEWTRFRGPNGQGQSDTVLPAAWRESDYQWHVALRGIGHSSPVLWGERLFITSAEQQGAVRLLLCLDAASGKTLWAKEFPSGSHHVHLQNSFASSTPTVDADRVYVAWTTPERYTVAALTHDGREAWQADLGKFTSQHGFGTSPIVYEDLLVINDDQDGESSLVALDRQTGSVRWRTQRRTKVVAYSTPCVYRGANGPAELIFNSEAHGITSIDPGSGKVNWETDVFNQRTVSSPLVVGSLIVGSCGSGGGNANYLVAVRPGREPQLAYKIAKSAPYVPTSVAKGDLLFLWSDKGMLSCLDAPRGKIHWQKRIGGNYSGSPVRSGDRLYCISVEGDVVVVAASDQYELLGRVPLGEISRSTPAIAGGRIYFRTQSHLYCLAAKPQNK